jgi:hypothetical protein
MLFQKLASDCFEFQALLSFGRGWFPEDQIDNRCGRFCLGLFDNLRETERFGLKLSIIEFGAPDPNSFSQSFVVLTRRARPHSRRSIAVFGDARKARRNGLMLAIGCVKNPCARGAAGAADLIDQRVGVATASFTEFAPWPI